MFSDASIDVGCATFNWTVEEPSWSAPKPQKPKLATRKCHDRHDHRDVHSEYVDEWSGEGCRDKSMKPGSESISWNPMDGGAFDAEDWYQNYRISWIAGCKEPREQNIRHPIEGDDGISCQQLMKDNYYKCESPAETSRRLEEEKYRKVSDIAPA